MISVVVPAYNVENLIGKTLDSIMSQTYKSLEIVVVNDGSIDNTGAVVEKYVQSYPEKIKVLHTENKGVTSARLSGVKIASGEWIGFVDSDDFIEKDMYEILIENAMKYQADISHCGYQMLFKDGRIHYFHGTGCIIEQDRISGLKELLEGSIIEPGLWNKLFRKDLFQNLINTEVMNLDIKFNEDLLMNYYLFLNSKKSVFVDLCKYHYLVRDTSVSRQQLNRHKIYDPLYVKKIILENCPEEIKCDAEKALLTTSVYTYCSLVVDSGKWLIEKKVVKEIIDNHYRCIEMLSGKMKILLILILKFPKFFDKVYPVYSKYIQKKKYD